MCFINDHWCCPEDDSNLESYACYFISDHYLTTYVTCLTSCLNLFLIHFCSLFLLILHNSHSYISADFFLLIDLRSSSYLLHPIIHVTSFLCISGILPCVLMFTHLSINACPLHLLLLTVLSAHSSVTQSSCVFPSLFATCIFKICLQFTLHWPFITHWMTYLLISLWTTIPLALLQHCIMIVTHSVTFTPLAQLFSSDPLWFCYTFPLWLSQPFRLFSAHTHTQAPTFLSQWSHIVFPLPSSVDTRIFYTCMPPTTCHSLCMVLSDPFCGTGKFLLLVLLQHSVIVII